MNTRYWEVAVEAPLPQALTYQAPASLGDLSRGTSVVVPLGKRKATGVVLQATKAPESPEFEVREILEINSELPVLSERFTKWLEWVSRYYLHPIGQVFTCAFPPLGKNTKRASKRPPVVPKLAFTNPLPLTPQQRTTLDGLLEKPGFGVHLIFGVTGSGKTEIYLQFLEKILAEGKQALVLVPEISLTPQLIRRFSARFGDLVAVIHSHLTDREKTSQWWEMVDGNKKILIGARSALFCPMPNLGAIILDEEHEPSFKQEEQLKYHARDAAIMLAKEFDCPIILGSATPSLESWNNAVEKKYTLHVLDQRVENRPLPAVTVVDLREFRKAQKEEEGEKLDQPFWLSPYLQERMVDRLSRGEQVALFLNRRGMAHVVVCPLCGATKECPNCSVALTLHGKAHLTCHYCDYHENMTGRCADCREGDLRPIGAGTERVEDDVKRLFPNATVARADRDLISNRKELEELIEKIENREVNVLVGTQMIAKGLDFEGLTLVGVVLADVGFNLPDFRASERSFQLLTQVAGRAGRHKEPGEVVIQTYNPEHISITYSQNHDFRGFAEKELAFRRELSYPPYGKIASIRVQGAQMKTVQKIATELRDLGARYRSESPSWQQVEILGPAEAALARLRGQYRFQLLVKAPDAKSLNSFCRRLSRVSAAGVKISVDIDPLHML